MRASILCAVALVLSACGSSTDVAPTRYNFAIVDGRNQASVAGTAQLAAPITSQLTKDPQGKFATRVFDFFAPAVAYAQGLTLSGTPVANAIVCGRVAPIGEPQVVPLCAFTLADGRAANAVQPGTKAGKYNILFTAQVPATEPVKDSTTVTVAAGPVAANRYYVPGVTLNGLSPFQVDVSTVPSDIYVVDQFNNRVPYRLVATGPAHTVSDSLGALSGRTVVADPGELCSNSCSGTFRPEEWGTVDVITPAGTIATGKLRVSFNNPGWAISLSEFRAP